MKGSFWHNFSAAWRPADGGGKAGKVADNTGRGGEPVAGVEG